MAGLLVLLPGDKVQATADPTLLEGLHDAVVRYAANPGWLESAVRVTSVGDRPPSVAHTSHNPSPFVIV